MILGEVRATDPRDTSETAALDAVFRQAVSRRPDATALSDPPNRQSFTTGAPRRLSFAEADRIISSIACRLRKLGLSPDAVVAIQLPNTVEAVLTILAVLRAGLIAAPMPLLWRRAEAAPALNSIGAKVIITTSRVGEVDHCELAMQIAAATFPVRYVCGFGPDLPDGIIPFDDLLTAPEPEPLPDIDRGGDPASHVAMVTWDVTPQGPIAVARSHTELMAGGQAVRLEGGLHDEARILAGCALGSFPGLAATMLPWLQSGGTLVLHHAFDADTFAAQCRDERCDTVVIPGPLASRLAEAGLLNHPELKNVLALWRTPERLLNAQPWDNPNAQMVDLLAFGEIAIIGTRRDVVGRPDPPSAVTVTAPRGAANAVLVVDVARTLTGTLALRGPMVPRSAFPPGAERLAAPHLKASPDGFVDTGYACRLDRMTDTFMVSGPPAGIVSVGGYRFVLNELEELVRRANNGAFITALPDALAGHRLAGITGETGDMQSMLSAQGLNPLLVDAFKAKPKAA